MLRHLKTIPNQFTAFRLLLIPILWIFAFLQLPFYIGVGLIIALLTDALDGPIAGWFVEDSVIGYLVAPRDIDAMADRLVWLLRNPDQARAMGQAGRAMVERHSLDRSIEAHERLYRSLVL